MVLVGMERTEVVADMSDEEEWDSERKKDSEIEIEEVEEDSEI